MNRAYTVRTEVINATGPQWVKIHELEVKGVISAKPEDLIKVTGFFGGLSAEFNDEERAFYDRFVEVAREAV